MNLTHHFLISMPQMLDDCFRNSVIYVLDHGEQGAFGVIINDASGMQLDSLLSQIDIRLENELARETTVLRGGPVDQGHGLVLHEPGPSFDATRNFADGVSVSSSRDVLEAIARGDEPSTYLVVLGHSGWAPGQLEMEIVKNSWLTCKADTDILFRTRLKDRRQAVASLIGVNMSNVVGHSGHA